MSRDSLSRAEVTTSGTPSSYPEHTVARSRTATRLPGMYSVAPALIHGNGLDVNGLDHGGSGARS
jgi:hypothetical protein